MNALELGPLCPSDRGDRRPAAVSVPRARCWKQVAPSGVLSLVSPVLRCVLLLVAGLPVVLPLQSLAPRRRCPDAAALPPPFLSLSFLPTGVF